VVNEQGALVLIHETVQLEQELQVRNLATAEQTACLVKDMTAGKNGVTEVGLEFADPHPRFWRISFPPADWRSHGPEARRFTTPIVPPRKPAK
jgi:hypothetical protein